VLRNGRERIFCISAEALDRLPQWGVSPGIVERVGQLPWDQDFREKEFDHKLREQIPKVGESTCGRIREAAALAAYHAGAGHMRLLVCDDAKPFKLVADELALCWIHDGRHYHSLEPCVPQHGELLKAFRKRYLDFYQVRRYQQSPTPERAVQLGEQVR
jgi:hypothetical protein